MNTIEIIGTGLFFVLGFISFSKRILKPKTQIITNFIAFIANGLYAILAYQNGLYLMLSLEIVYCLMCVGCMVRFYILYKRGEKA